MEKKLLFVYNPHAGKAQIRSNLLDIIDIFTKAGYTVTARPTQKPGDAREAVLSRNGEYDLVVCSGGDGTLDEAVTGMMMGTERIPIGYVPAGTTNDFARSLKISGNMQKAAADIVDGREYACDVGRFNDDIFVYIAAFGLFTDVSYETKQQIKNVLGHLAYLLEGVKRISSIPCYHLRVTCDGQTLEGDYMFGMVTNSRSVGGFSKITGKQVDLNDGLFEVTLIKMPYNMVELNLILTSVIGHKIHSDYMQCFKAASLTIETDEAIPWTLDGEFGGKHKEVNIQNEFQGLRLIIPEKR